jgi:hypothetical protein
MLTDTGENSRGLTNENGTRDVPDGIGDLQTADYSESYQNSGADVNLTLHQSILNTSTISFSNLDNKNKFSEPFPNFNGYNTSLVNVSINNIYAPNKTMNIELGTTGTQNIYSGDNYFSFQVKGTGYLTNFSVCLDEYANLDDDDCQISVEIYTSQWINSRIEPKSFISGSQILDWIPNGTDTVWFNFTYSNLKLDASSSNTYEKTFFIRLVQLTSTLECRSRYHNENNLVSGGDDSIVYKDEGLPTLTLLNTDPSLEINLRPLNNVPEPTEIGLDINNTAVSNITSGSGFWNPSKSYNSTTNEFEFEITTDWWDVSCDITKVQLNYTKTDIVATSEFEILGSGQDVLWNVTRNGGLNYFDSRLNNYTINFTIPSTWNDVEVWTGDTNKTDDRVLNPLGNGYTEVQVLNAGNGDFWFLNATSNNLITSIGTNPIDEANYSDKVLLNASFITLINSAVGNDKGVNLSIYNPEAIDTKLNYTDLFDTYNSDEIDLGDWDIATNITEYGIFRIQVFWSNDTAAGFKETLITVLGETDVQTSTAKTPNNIFNVTETFNITVGFDDTGQTLPIDNANINYTIDGGVNWRYDNITALGNGEYNITIHCNDTQFNGYGVKSIQVNASKQYYNNDTDSFDITILAPTKLKIDPLSKTDFASSESFNITIQYNDTYIDDGIPNAIINYTLDGTTWRYENVEYIGEGKYNITINCNDDDFDDYGSFTITINASKQFYHNQSKDDQITITGENLLAIDFPSDFDMYYSTEVFNITVSFEDPSRGNQGIDNADIEAQIDGGADLSPLITHLGSGQYNITLDGGNILFSNFGLFTIRVNASKPEYENATNTIDLYIIGNTTFSVQYPPMGAYYGPTGFFNITVFYYDISNDEGEAGATVEYSIEGNVNRTDEVYDLGNGQYNITINIADVNFTYYGVQDIDIKVSKTSYHNTSTVYTFNRQTSTKITPLNTVNFDITRGANVSYTFNYSQSDGTPIEGASWELISNDGNLIYAIYENGDGNYTVSLNSTGISAQAYTFAFNISAIGNQTQDLTLEVTVLLPETSIDFPTTNLDVNVLQVGVNLTLNFNFTDAYQNKPITDIKTENVTVKQGNFFWYEVVNGTNGDFTHFANGGWLLVHNGKGNHTLIISTYGLTIGNLYTILIRIEYTASNPGVYNYSEYTIDFYYGTTSAPSDGGGGGGGGDGGTTITGIAQETLIFYIIIIGVVVALAGAIAGIQKGVIAPKKREKERVLREVTTVFDDAINMEHILLIYKGTGTCIFFKSYGMEEIDPELISGFLTAVSSFGREMDSQEALNEIKYGDKMLLLADGEFIRVALVLEKSASIILRQHLKEFIDAFENKFTAELPKWKGQMNVFRDSGDIIDDVLNTSIILPHVIDFDMAKIKALKAPYSKRVLKIAQNLVEDSDRKFFFIATLLVEAVDRVGKDKAQIFMGIKELRDAKILTPIQLAHIEEAPISQQELNLLKQRIQKIPNITEKEIQNIVNELAQMNPAEREAYITSRLEQQKIVSAPIKSKAGEKIIENSKVAKKEIKNLKKEAKNLIKEKKVQEGIDIYRQAALIASDWDMTSQFEEIEDTIRIVRIKDLSSKMKKLEAEAKVSAKAGIYGEAAEKFKLASDAASQIFKLGVTEMTKEVKRLTNKSKEFEKLT